MQFTGIPVASERVELAEGLKKAVELIPKFETVRFCVEIVASGQRVILKNESKIHKPRSFICPSLLKMASAASRCNSAMNY